MHDLDVFTFCTPADVVGLAGPAFFKDFYYGIAMVDSHKASLGYSCRLHKQVRFFFHDVEYHQRDQFFRELVGAVIV